MLGQMLLSERMALVRCHKIRVSFPSERAATNYRRYTASPTILLSPLRLDRVRYTLSGDDSYEFYVRKFANTVMWTYGGGITQRR